MKLTESVTIPTGKATLRGLNLIFEEYEISQK
ncbi:Uncharacterised protein [Streptococcus pneumoniae]|nr:Uncharacterised protein [Streptococcus pneumoniae]